jgi:hypothetical protein
MQHRGAFVDDREKLNADNPFPSLAALAERIEFPHRKLARRKVPGRQNGQE